MVYFKMCIKHPLPWFSQGEKLKRTALRPTQRLTPDVRRPPAMAKAGVCFFLKATVENPKRHGHFTQPKPVPGCMCLSHKRSVRWSIQKVEYKPYQILKFQPLKKEDLQRSSSKSNSSSPLGSIPLGFPGTICSRCRPSPRRTRSTR